MPSSRHSDAPDIRYTRLHKGCRTPEALGIDADPSAFPLQASLPPDRIRPESSIKVEGIEDKVRTLRIIQDSACSDLAQQYDREEAQTQTPPTPLSHEPSPPASTVATPAAMRSLAAAE